MNPTLLIDAIVRQTMVLIAQLATSAGVRAPLSHVANQVFLDLVRELEAQGVRRKVAADMFGMALRTYQKKVRRLSESATDRGRTLWEALFTYLSQERVVSRADVLRRFHRDEDATVRGVLRDMVASGLVFESGAGSRVAYRVATEEDLGLLAGGDDREETATLAWATIYRLGPMTLDELNDQICVERPRLEALVERLTGDGSVSAESGPDAATRYRASRFIVPVDARAGWAAAVFDHYQAVVQTVLARLSGDDPEARYPGRAGGSTWSFDIWPGHPHEQDVLSVLDELRARMGALRAQVTDHNERAGRPPDHARVTIYLGQSVIDSADDAPTPATEETPS